MPSFLVHEIFLPHKHFLRSKAGMLSCKHSKQRGLLSSDKQISRHEIHVLTVLGIFNNFCKLFIKFDK